MCGAFTRRQRLSQLTVSVSPKRSRNLVRLVKVLQKIVICRHAATFPETRNVQSHQGRWKPYAGLRRHETRLFRTTMRSPIGLRWSLSVHHGELDGSELCKSDNVTHTPTNMCWMQFPAWHFPILHTRAICRTLLWWYTEAQTPKWTF